jgi:hypothetical protein
MDRWNQANMLGWGPTLATIAFRRLTARERGDTGVPDLGRPRCVLLLAVHSRRTSSGGCSGEALMPGNPKFCVYRSSTFVCVIAFSGAYLCPHNADESSPLRHPNATTTQRGVLRLNVPLRGTHETPRLAWQRYPHADGVIEPWARPGTLRRGLRFSGSDRGTCIAGSELIAARSALTCFNGVHKFDACFSSRSNWNRRGAVVACGSLASTTFSRFVISKRT